MEMGFILSTYLLFFDYTTVAPTHQYHLIKAQPTVKMKPVIAAAMILALLFKQTAAVPTFTVERDSIPSAAEQNSSSFQTLPPKGALPVDPLPAVLPRGSGLVAPQPSASPVVRSEPPLVGEPEPEQAVYTFPIVYFPYFPAPSSGAGELPVLVGDTGIALALVAAAAILWA
ncbi:sphingolipid homeostasis protein orm1 [Hypoxylon texense]